MDKSQGWANPEWLEFLAMKTGRKIEEFQQMNEPELAAAIEAVSTPCSVIIVHTSGLLVYLDGCLVLLDQGKDNTSQSPHQQQ